AGRTRTNARLRAPSRSGWEAARRGAAARARKRRPDTRSAAPATAARAGSRWRARRRTARRRTGPGRCGARWPRRASRGRSRLSRGWLMHLPEEAAERRRAERLAHQLEGAIGGQRAHLPAVAAEMRQLRAGAVRARERQPDGADRLLGRAAVGACDASDGGTPRRSRDPPRAFGHGAGDLLADGSVHPQQLGGDAQGLLLELVGVDDEAARGPARAAGDFGEQLGNQAARAALRAADGFAAPRQLLADGLCEGDSVGAVDEAAQDGPA